MPDMSGVQSGGRSAEERVARWSERVRKWHPADRFQDARSSDFSDDVSGAIQQLLTAWSRVTSQGEPGVVGLLLHGAVGVGKTRAGFAVCNEVVTVAPRTVVKFCTEATLLTPDDVKPWDRPAQAAQAAGEVDVLLVDEVGMASFGDDANRIATWMRFTESVLSREKPLLLVMTTNRTRNGSDGWDHLTDWFGPQVRSRLEPRTLAVSPGDRDHRRVRP